LAPEPDEWLRTIALRGSIGRPNVIRPQLCGLLILAADGFIDFSPVNGDVLGSFDAQLHLVAADIDDRYDHIVADDDAFIPSSRENQHGRRPNLQLMVYKPGG